MKKVIGLFLLAAFMIIGCDDSSIVEPTAELNEDSFLPKGRPILVRDYDKDFFFLYDSTGSGGNVKLEDLETK